MSAYIVEQNHIEYLVDALFSPTNDMIPYLHHDLALDKATPDKVGQLLWEENHRSVNFRYKEKGETPRFKYRGKCYASDPLQVIKSIHCYNYQTCEHPEWETSGVKKILGRLEHRINSILTDGKIWGAPEPQAGVVRLSRLPQTI